MEEVSFDDLDRTFFTLSSTAAEPLYWAYGLFCYKLVAPIGPGKFDNSTSLIVEVATRALIAGGAVLSFCFAGTHLLLASLTLGSASLLFRCVGFALQKEGFTHIRGNAPEKELVDGEMKVMTWDVSGHRGGLHYERGVVHWRSRVDRIVEQIKKEDPDVVFLQEVYDTALVEALIEKLEDSYAHFFAHSGGNGCLAFSKCAVHRFTHENFISGSRNSQGGFETLEMKAKPDDCLPCVRMIGAQLIQGDSSQKKRIDQVTQIVNSVAKQTIPLPTLFVGNSRGEQSKEDEALLSNYLQHSYRGDEPTQTDRLIAEWDSQLKSTEGTCDFISLFKRNPQEGKSLPVVERGIRLLDCHLVHAYDSNYDTKTAIAERHGIVTTLSLKNS